MGEEIAKKMEIVRKSLGAGAKDCESNPLADGGGLHPVLIFVIVVITFLVLAVGNTVALQYARKRRHPKQTPTSQQRHSGGQHSWTSGGLPAAPVDAEVVEVEMQQPHRPWL